MSGRGRGRPPSRSAQESAAGPSRRSTRHQQQQQNATEAQHEDQEQQPHQDLPLPQEEQQQQQHQQQQQQPQEQQYQQQDQQQPQLEAPMSAPGYHQIIDPAITGSQDATMPPPPIPSAKNLRGQIVPHPARRYTRRDVRASSMASINSLAPTDAYSSQPDPYGTAAQKSPGRVFGTPIRAASTIASEIDETPSRKVGRAKLMNRMLPRLFTASDELFTHLCTDTADPEMWEIERRGFKNIFDVYRAHYVPDISNPVVDPNFVVNTMRFDAASSLSNSVFKIVSAANLTSLLDEISPIHQLDLLPLLQGWDSTFPEYFVPEDFDNNDSSTNEQIIEQALMIRTQLSIFTLRKLQESATPFHPYEQVAKIWCDGDVSVEAVEAFLAGNKDALQLKPIPAMEHSEAASLARERNDRRFVSLCTMLRNQPVLGFNLDLSDIDQNYPFDEFVDNLRTFVRTCFGKIKASLQQGSSASQNPLALPPSEGTSRADSQIRSQLENEAMAHGFDRAESGAPSLSYNMDSLRRMKQMEQQASAAYGDGHQLPPGTYPPAPRIPYPPGFSSPTPTPGSMYAESANQVGVQPDGSNFAESAAQASDRKRRSQDDGAAGSAPPAKKPRRTRKKNDVPDSSAAPSTAVSTARAASVIRSQYPPLPGSQDEPDLEALSQRTREISAANRKNKEPQVRSAWVRNDVRLLVKAVDAYSCKWSTIEKEIKAGTIPFERPRDQQALRDKARLLKQDFLKADAILPRGFDYVVLGKKEREAVKACGKNPDRKEADVDENGQPINTELDQEGILAPLPEPMPAHLPAPLPAPPSAEPQQEPQQGPQQGPQQEPQPEPQQELQPELQAAVPEPAAV